MFDRNNGGAWALAFARLETGDAYLFGGSAPGPTDCSGLWEWAYGRCGVVIPRSTYEQYLTAQINKASARLPGDLLFIAGSDPGAHGEPGHVMGYVAPGRVFEAACTACGPIGEVAFDTNSPLIEYVTRPALLLPPAPPAPPHPQPTENPTDAQLAASGHPPLVPMLNGDQSREARANGWTLWYWTGFHFAPVVPTTRLHPGERQYARTGWQTPKAGR